MNCSVCHQPLKPNENFCLGCGFPVATFDSLDVTGNTTVKEPKLKVKPLILGLVFGGIACVLVAGGYIGISAYQKQATHRLAHRFLNAIHTKNSTAIASMIDPSENALKTSQSLSVFHDSLDPMVDTFYNQAVNLALNPLMSSNSWVSFKKVNGSWYIHLPEFVVNLNSGSGDTDSLLIQNQTAQQTTTLLPSIYTYALSIKAKDGTTNQTGTINAFNAFRMQIQNKYVVQLPANSN